MDTAISLKTHDVEDAPDEHVEAIRPSSAKGSAASWCASDLIVENFYHAVCTAEHVLSGKLASVPFYTFRTQWLTPRLCVGAGTAAITAVQRQLAPMT